MRASLSYTRGDKIYIALNTVLLILIGLMVLYPILFIVSASFSAGSSESIALFSGRFSLEGYRAVFEVSSVWTGYANSFLYMAAGTAISVFLTVCAAYPLSCKELFMRGWISMLFLFTMYFSGGLIPSYLLAKRLGIINTVWAVLLPGALSVYNMIVLRTSFSTQIPSELREAAEIDGCGEVRFLVRIVLPLSGATLSVIALFYAVAMWNSYFNAMIYLTKRSLFPLQLVLREILILNQTDISAMDAEEIQRIQERQELMRYSLIIIASVPMMCLYPLVQRYFVKGVMIGAVKG